jgi:hypothetical protein
MYYSVTFKNDDGLWLGQPDIDTGEIEEFIPLDLMSSNTKTNTLYYVMVDEKQDDFSLYNLIEKPITDQDIIEDDNLFMVVNQFLKECRSTAIH